ncbi:hypothetical protein BDV59DRAFT_208004 [Aspergillus ambiguus]|uniref:sulfotransferase family protein n=1 Tax=Aspergillus ambiguus TaxID=176160 RepID=UPI003CCDAECC
MGQNASVPKPGTRIQVIGAGLPRTGTASLTAALDLLLDGPVYHCGTQTTMGPPSEIESWTKILHCWLSKDQHERCKVLPLIKSKLDGFGAIMDAPGSQMVPELMELYPDSKVICTVRDPASWEKSMNHVHGFTSLWFLKALLLPLPGMRNFIDYAWLMSDQWGKMYRDAKILRDKKVRGNVKEYGDALLNCHIYERHIEWLKQTVPEDRLVFLNVNEGWGPLCKAIGKDVPHGIPFPHINDSEATEGAARYHIQRALIRWAGIFAVVTVVVAGYMITW